MESWVRFLQAEPTVKHDFIDSMQERIQGLKEVGTMHARNYEEVLGVRYAIGEIERLVSLLTFEQEEELRYGDLESQSQ